MLLPCQQTWPVYAFLVTLYFVALPAYLCLWLPITSSEVFSITFSNISHTSCSEISSSSQSNSLKCTLSFTLHDSFAKRSQHLQRIREMATPNHLSRLYPILSQNRREQNSSCSQPHCTSVDSSIPPWQSISFTKNNVFNVVFGLTVSFICMWESQSDTVCDIHNPAISFLFFYSALTFIPSASRFWKLV